jgi:hypothetical protein
MEPASGLSRALGPLPPIRALSFVKSATASASFIVAKAIVRSLKKVRKKTTNGVTIFPRKI